MPARTTGTPGRIPARLTWLRALPQHEIQWILLGLIDLDARADLQVLDLAPRQLAVTDELADPVIDITIARCIGEAFIDERLDHRVHAGDMVRRTWLDIRTQHVEASFVLVHGGDHALDQRLERLAVLAGTTNDLVVDVGDVTYVGHIVAAMAQPTGDHVERDHHPCMTDVAEVIDRHATDVHAHLVVFQRAERFLGLGQRVVDRQRHH